MLAVDEVPRLVETLSSEALRLRDSREVDGAVAEEVVLSSATIVDLILLPSARMFRLISSSASVVEDLEGTSILAGVRSFLSTLRSAWAFDMSVLGAELSALSPDILVD